MPQPNALPLAPHPDRLLPSEPSRRAVARRLLAHVADLPLVSPHGHIDAGILARDEAFPDPAALLVTPDHYVTRMLYSAGVPLDRLGVRNPDADPREIWRLLCAHWHLFRGTPSRLWLESELHDLFGVREQPSAGNADALYDRITAALAEPELRPRALYHRFNLEVLATTDNPWDDLADHRALADDPSWKGRVAPTFRPDGVTDPERPDIAANLRLLAEASGIDTADYAGYLAALRDRRRHFLAHGASCTDHGVEAAGTAPLEASAAAEIYGKAYRGEPVTAAEGEAFRAHMLFESARMSVEDGLVMQLHPGVRRNHHRAVFEEFGPDTGCDIPVATEYTRALQPLLNAFGREPGFTFVVFTVDETSFSREIAPLAGHYPAMKVGAPWWFLDAPEAILRWRAAVTETAGFYNTAGFVDDTRAFCSIAARHDVARRLDCAYLSGLVAEHRLSEEEAAQTAADLAHTLPKQVFRV
ncbi:glucuronate isomerase [Mangrovactinospora gilvigrisea]|uniref:Uronate isomerase n=1 Tax=Mangrovactinospora gilvigrisea TaxID=1428644 RepID=A0A1J7BB77_9ACTN|nr:glucuronate isomerase [Mangrovactinospora gilvigrisea]OIV35861.1 glucuronate isomerase [Mangrovactinospora gilvigrisea]